MAVYGKPITERLIREFVPFDVALYSLWMPGNETTATIQSTHLDPVCTYDEIIELDDVADACVAYLVSHGAPVFNDVNAHQAYTTALERELQRGLGPQAARDAALRSSRVQARTD